MVDLLELEFEIDELIMISLNFSSCSVELIHFFHIRMFFSAFKHSFHADVFVQINKPPAIVFPLIATPSHSPCAAILFYANSIEQQFHLLFEWGMISCSIIHIIFN